MKRLLITATLLVIVLAILTLAFLSFYRTPTGKVVGEKYKIGLILPLTGTFSFYGEMSLQGAMAAVQNHPEFQVIVEDDSGEPAKAVSAANKLINIDNVDALVTVRSSISSSVAPVAEENKVPLVYSSTINFPAENKTYVFKNFINIRKDCELLSDLIDGKVSLIGYDLDSTRECIDAFQSKGVNVKFELFDAGEADFRTMISKIKQDAPDFLILRGDNKILPLMLRQMQELDVKNLTLVCPHIIGAGCKENKTLQEYGSLFVNALGTDAYVKKTDRMAEIDKELMQRLDRQPIDLSYSTYEGVTMLIPVIQACAGDKACVVQKLLSEEFEGVDSRLKFNSQGIIERETNLMKFQDGEWVLME